MSQEKKNVAEDIKDENIKAQAEETAEETVAEQAEEQTEETATDASNEEKETKDKKDQKIDELNDRLMRNMAEFENFRKRSEKEKNQMFEIGAKSIVEKILPIIDNFERGLGTVTEAEKESAFVQGIEQIYKQFITALEEAGVKPIEAVGQEFNRERIPAGEKAVRPHAVNGNQNDLIHGLHKLLYRSGTAFRVFV